MLAEDVQTLWLTAAAGAAAARDPDLLQQALAGARAWAEEADVADAAFLAGLVGAEAAACLASDQPAAAVAAYSRALHLCPWGASLRAGLVAAVLGRRADGGKADAADAALRMLGSPAMAAAAQRTLRAAPAGKVRG